MMKAHKKIERLEEEVHDLKQQLEAIAKERDQAVSRLRAQELSIEGDDPRQIALLDAVHSVARLVPTLGPSATRIDQMLAVMALARLASNVQAFLVLLKLRFFVDAYGVARFLTELAINLCWVHLGDKFGGPAERTAALEQDGQAWLKTWWEKMNTHRKDMPFGEELVRKFEEATANAKFPGLPNLQQRSEVAEVVRGIYDFAYRGESSAAHGHVRALYANMIQEPPLAKHLMLHNLLVSSLAIFGAASHLLENADCRATADRLQKVILDLVPKPA